MVDAKKTRAETEQAVLGMLKEAHCSIPGLLLKYYKALQLNETEIMVIIHIVAFKQLEWNEFPTMDELLARMNISADVLDRAMQRLLKEQYLGIDTATDPVTGMYYEKYNTDKLMRKLVQEWLKEQGKERESFTARMAAGTGAGAGANNIFSVFEQEFARPLTPMECEMITVWLDQEQYGEELVVAALKEAVFAGKVHFRYIDRILLDWSKNRVKSLDDVKMYTQKFRGER